MSESAKSLPLPQTFTRSRRGNSRSRISSHARDQGDRAGVRRKLLRARLSDLPLPITLLLLALLLPPELDFYLGGLRLNCLRLILVLFLPPAIGRLLSSRGPKLRSFDFLLVGAFAYFALTFFLKQPLPMAIQSGGIVFLEGVGTYLITRAYIRNAYQFLAAVKLLFFMVLIAGAFAIPESILHSHFARDIAAAISGAPTISWGETRLGLLRAMSVFEHPIHYGVFCASVFGLVWFTQQDPARRIFLCSLIGGATFFSLSSAPLLGIGLILMGAVVERTTRNIPHRVWLMIALIALVYLLLSLVANRTPIEIIISTFVFDTGTAWYRVLIWTYGIDNVANNPWIGVPFGFWERPSWMPSDTLDNYWLALALWGGLPTVTLLVLAIVGEMRAVHGPISVAQTPDLRSCRYAWTATVLALCVVGATVYYWGALGVLFVFYLGLGGWLAEPQ